MLADIGLTFYTQSANMVLTNKRWYEMKRITVQLDEELLQKFRVIAEYEKRSLNKELMIIIRECIDEYEAIYGSIEKK